MQYEHCNYLAHHGIKGQKWGVRRYQNMDGSLTSRGRQRYESDGSKSNPYARFYARHPKTRKAVISVGRKIYPATKKWAAYGRSIKQFTNTKFKSNKVTSKRNRLSKGQKRAIKLGVGAAAVAALSVGGYQYMKLHPEATNMYFTGRSPAYDQAAKEGKKFVMFMGSGDGNIGRGRMARGFSVL